MENDIKDLVEGYSQQSIEENWQLDDWLTNINTILDETYKKKDYHPNIVIQFLYQFIPELNINSPRFKFELTRQEKIEQNKQLKYLKNLKRQHAQRTDGWKQWRYNHINASEAHKVLTGSRNSLLRDKVKPYENNNEIGIATEHGIRFEPLSTAIYTEKTGKHVYDFDSIEHPTYTFLAASPDGIDEDGIMLEIKNPHSRPIIGVPKPDYYTQTQLQMEVCNMNQCNFLECKFEEYPCLEYYIEDQNIEYKGIIIEFTNQNFYRQRYYSPFNITGNDLEDWLENTRNISKDGQDVNEIYWKLSNYSV